MRQCLKRLKKPKKRNLLKIEISLSKFKKRYCILLLTVV